ncbi:MAG: hypothetical protein KDD34_02815 [Bdellovibrionales bacterium]|nr:hypothetical protein [Bdellovibrionales bacterium]
MEEISETRFYFNCHITFPDSLPSPAVKNVIIEYLQDLEEKYKNIISCHVAIKIPHKHHRKKIIHTDISFKTGFGDFFVNHDKDKNYSHEDPLISLRDAFEALENQLNTKLGMLHDKRVKSKSSTKSKEEILQYDWVDDL